MIHAYVTGLDDHAEVLDAVTIELTLLWLQVQVIFFETLQDFMRCLSVGLFVGAVDQDVIHIDGHLSSCNQICKDRVHKRLEGSGRIGEAEVHNTRLKQSSVHNEHCLLLVCFLNSDIIISPPDVKLREDFCLHQAVNDIGSERQQVAIFDRDGVELPVILYKAEFSIFLLDEEDRGYHW